jgi:hypothetical protein
MAEGKIKGDAPGLTADPSTAPLAMRPREASLRMTCSLFLRMTHFLFLNHIQRFLYVDTD